MVYLGFSKLSFDALEFLQMVFHTRTISNNIYQHLLYIFALYYPRITFLPILFFFLLISSPIAYFPFSLSWISFYFSLFYGSTIVFAFINQSIYTYNHIFTSSIKKKIHIMRLAFSTLVNCHSRSTSLQWQSLKQNIFVTTRKLWNTDISGLRSVWVSDMRRCPTLVRYLDDTCQTLHIGVWFFK